MEEQEGQVIDVVPEEIEEPEAVETESSGRDPIARIRASSERILSRILIFRASSEAPEETGEPPKEKRAPKKRSVRLQTLTYNEETEEYTLAETGTFFEDLPPEAVHVTGKKGRYFLDLVEDPDHSDPEGIRATDLYLWMVNNSINDALAVKDKSIGSADIRRYIVIGIGLIVGVCVIYAMI